MLAKKPKGATQKRKSSSASGLLWMFVGAILTLMIGVFLYLSPLFDFSPTGAPETDPNRQVQPRVNTDVDNSDYEFYDILPDQEMATIPDEAIGNSNSDQIGGIEAFEPDVVITQPNSTQNDSSNAGTSESTPSEPDRGAQNNAGSNDSDNDIVVIEENATYDGTVPSTTTKPNNAPVTAPKPTAATTYILQINSFGNADEADRRRAQVLMAGIDAKVVKNTTGSGAPIYQVISRPMNNRQMVTSAQQRLQNNGIDSIIVEQRR